MICLIFHYNLGKRKICITFFHSLIDEKKEHRITTRKKLSTPVTAIDTYVRILHEVSFGCFSTIQKRDVRAKSGKQNHTETQSVLLAEVNDQNNVDLSVS